jgi:hypothetical protein
LHWLLRHSAIRRPHLARARECMRRACVRVRVHAVSRGGGGGQLQARTRGVPWTAWLLLV